MIEKVKMVLSKERLQVTDDPEYSNSIIVVLWLHLLK
jgi:hypothetical protein